MLTPPEAAERLRRASFKVRIEEENGVWWWGTAFFISADGVALTAYHNLPKAVRDAGRGQVTGEFMEKPLRLEYLVDRSVPEEEGDIALLQWNEAPAGEVPHVEVGGLDPVWLRQRRVQLWGGRPGCVFGFPFARAGQGEKVVHGSVDVASPLVDFDMRDQDGAGPNIIAHVEWMRFAAGLRAGELRGISGAGLLDRESGLVVAVEHRCDQALDPNIVYCTEIGPHAARLGIRFRIIGPSPTRYLEWLRGETSHIEIRGLRVSGQSVGQFRIDQLYTPLTTVSLQDRARRPGAEPGQRQAPLQEALRERRVLLVGDPGGGKTTFLRRIAFAACETLLGKNIAAWPDLVPATPCLWPVLLRARRLAAYIAKHAAELDSPEADSAEWLTRYLLHDSPWQLEADFFRDKFEEGCLLLVDGLDEVAGDAARNSLARLLDHAGRRYPDVRIVASSRPPARAGQAAIPGFETVRIWNLENAAIEIFVANWCRCLYPEEGQRAEEHQKDLLGQIVSKPAIREMALNPVMLTALAALHWHKRRLPNDRWELYDSVLKWLAEARTEKRAEAGDRLPAELCLKMMGSLALGMQADPRGRQVEVTRYEAAQILAPAFRDKREHERHQEAERFLAVEEEDSGIVVGRDGLGAENTVRFWHLTFQEFLAAIELGGDDDARRRLLFEAQRLYEPAWREVVLLLAATLWRQGRARADGLFKDVLDGLELPTGPLQPALAEALSSLPRGMEPPAEWLAKLRGRSDPVGRTGPTLADRARCVGLIGMALQDLQVSGYRLEDSRYGEHLKKVLAIFDAKEAVGIGFETRLEAADALGQAGDPRLKDEVQKWVRLNGGEYWMGAQKDDPGSPNFDGEAPRVAPVRKVTVGPFEVGRYPVTVQEYGKFVKEGGYQKAGLWGAGGMGEYERPEDWGRQARYPSRPVAGVSWYEAAAYCRWAGRRLLTEEEWEYAARDGQSGKRYPWGNAAPGPELVNIGNQPGHATPVGLYPAGATGRGVQDMAGNVEEWTSSQGVRGSAARVVRGGSWDSNREYAACASRAFCHPASRGYYIGFRCART